VLRPHRLVSWAVPVGLAALLALPGSAFGADLLHWWKADGDFTDAVDTNDGSGPGGTTFATGVSGQAFSLDGVDDYISIPDAPTHRFAGSFSVDAWVATTAANMTIAVYYDCAQFCPNVPSLYSLRLANGQGYGVVRDSTATGGDFGQNVVGGPAINDGAFHHVALVRDVDAGTLSLYVDYLLAAEEPLEAQSDGAITDGDGEPDPLTLGTQLVGGTSTPDALANARLDEVRLWSGANHPPRNSAAPAITGTAVEGGTLTCAPGDWSGAPSFSFEWLRDGAPIAGAAGATYALTAADVGRQIACRVTATNTGGSPTALSSAVMPSGVPGPPPPTGPLTLEDLPTLTNDDVGRIAQVAPRSGTVLVSLDGVTFVPLAEAREIPVGSFIDTRKGAVRLRSATGRNDANQTGDFSRGLFKLLQSRARRARGLTELRLKGGSFKRCGASGGRSASAALSRRTVRRLRSSATGRFRTRGRNSSATVRGTVWITTDRCDGTLTKVMRGRVAVRDFRRQRTVLVRAGRSYLARATAR
jgi:hypothetical protein